MTGQTPKGIVGPLNKDTINSLDQSADQAYKSLVKAVEAIDDPTIRDHAAKARQSYDLLNDNLKSLENAGQPDYFLEEAIQKEDPLCRYKLQSAAGFLPSKRLEQVAKKKEAETDFDALHVINIIDGSTIKNFTYSGLYGLVTGLSEANRYEEVIKVLDHIRANYPKPG